MKKSSWVRPAVTQFGSPEQALSYARSKASTEELEQVVRVIEQAEFALKHERGRRRRWA
jgi:hypothetical protein